MVCLLFALERALFVVLKFVLYRLGQYRAHFPHLLLVSATNNFSTLDRKPVVVPHECTFSACNASIVF